MGALALSAGGDDDGGDDGGSVGGSGEGGVGGEGGTGGTGGSGGAAPRCGDGALDPGEACDDGNLDDSDACVTSCVAGSCGDGIAQLCIEACDDRHAAPGDGCDDRYRLEATCGVVVDLNAAGARTATGHSIPGDATGAVDDSTGDVTLCCVDVQCCRNTPTVTDALEHVFTAD